MPTWRPGCLSPTAHRGPPQATPSRSRGRVRAVVVGLSCISASRRLGIRPRSLREQCVSIWAFVSFMRTARPLGLDCPRCGGRLRRFAARAPGPGAEYSASPPSSTGSPPADTSKAWASPNRARESPPAAQRPSAASRCPSTRPGKVPSTPPLPAPPPRDWGRIAFAPAREQIRPNPRPAPLLETVLQNPRCVLLPSAHRRGHWRRARGEDGGSPSCTLDDENVDSHLRRKTERDPRPARGPLCARHPRGGDSTRRTDRTRAKMGPWCVLTKRFDQP
jgi:hypothetical protein